MKSVTNPAQPALVVEDEVLVAVFLEEALRDMGLRSQVFTSGKPALQALASESFAVAVLDVGLPDMAGEEIVNALLERDPMMPIVITSGHDHRQLESRFKHAAQLRVLSKPFDADRLQAELKALGVS